MVADHLFGGEYELTEEIEKKSSILNLLILQRIASRHAVMSFEIHFNVFSRISGFRSAFVHVYWVVLKRIASPLRIEVVS